MNPVTLVDWLPAGMQYISSTAEAAISSNTITWPAFGPLANGSSQLFYVLARIKHSAEGCRTIRPMSQEDHPPASITPQWTGRTSPPMPWPWR